MQSLKTDNVPVQFITTDQLLVDLSGEWASLPWIALDTEFVRRDTYRAIPALIQVFDGSSVWLIDPQSGLDLSPLAEVMQSECVKIVHSAAEDLGVLFQCTGVWVKNLHDTQLAMSLLNLGQSVGYQKMISTILEVNLDKDETQSDWLKRPLTDQQVQYAADDVKYLAKAWFALYEQLAEFDRLDWLNEDCETLVNRSRELYEMPGDLAFYRVKGIGRLNRRALAVVRALAIWREALAAEKNIPKGRIIADRQLVEIGLRKSTSLIEFDQLAVPKGIIRNYGVLMGELVKGAMALDESQLPERFMLLPKDAKSWLEAVYKPVKEVALSLNLDAAVICRKKQLQDMVNHAWRTSEPGDWPEDIIGWRKDLIQAGINDALDTLLN